MLVLNINSLCDIVDCVRDIRIILSFVVEINQNILIGEIASYYYQLYYYKCSLKYRGAQLHMHYNGSTLITCKHNS